MNQLNTAKIICLHRDGGSLNTTASTAESLVWTSARRVGMATWVFKSSKDRCFDMLKAMCESVVTDDERA